MAYRGVGTPSHCLRLDNHYAWTIFAETKDRLYEELEMPLPRGAKAGRIRIYHLSSGNKPMIVPQGAHIEGPITRDKLYSKAAELCLAQAGAEEDAAISPAFVTYAQVGEFVWIVSLQHPEGGSLRTTIFAIEPD